MATPALLLAELAWIMTLRLDHGVAIRRPGVERR